MHGVHSERIARYERYRLAHGWAMAVQQVGGPEAKIAAERFGAWYADYAGSLDVDDAWRAWSNSAIYRDLKGEL